MAKTKVKPAIVPTLKVSSSSPYKYGQKLKVRIGEEWHDATYHNMTFHGNFYVWIEKVLWDVKAEAIQPL